MVNAAGLGGQFEESRHSMKLTILIASNLHAVTRGGALSSLNRLPSNNPLRPRARAKHSGDYRNAGIAGNVVCGGGNQRN